MPSNNASEEILIFQCWVKTVYKIVKQMMTTILKVKGGENINM